jgi:hypothetical protein
MQVEFTGVQFRRLAYVNTESEVNWNWSQEGIRNNADQPTVNTSYSTKRRGNT